MNSNKLDKIKAFKADSECFYSYLNENKDAIEGELNGLLEGLCDDFNYLDLFNHPLLDEFLMIKKYLDFMRMIDSANYPSDLLDKYNEKSAFYHSLLSSSQEYYNAVTSVLSKTDNEQEKEHLEAVLGELKRGGLGLNEEDRAQFLVLKNQLIALEQEYNENLQLSRDRTCLLLNSKEMESLPERIATQVKEVASSIESSGNYVIRYSTGLIDLVNKHSTSKELRRKSYNVLSCLGYIDSERNNLVVGQKIIDVTHRIAKLLGLSTPEYLMKNNMLNSGEVLEFLEDLKGNALAGYQQEFKEYLDFAKKKLGYQDVTASDRAYVLELLRNEKHNINEDAIKKHFPLERTLDNVLKEVGDIFDLKFVKNNQMPVINKEKLIKYEVYKDGESAGELVLDLIQRDGKRGGGCCFSLQSKSDTTLPVVVILSNVRKGADGVFLESMDVKILLHELGHALHHLLSDNQVKFLNGTGNVQRDAVEFPSQFLENLFYNKPFLKRITENEMDDEMIDSIIRFKDFQRYSYDMRHYVLSKLDALMYSEEGRCLKATEMDLIRENYPYVTNEDDVENELISPVLHHIFTAGYKSGLYVYRWAKMMSDNLYNEIIVDEDGSFHLEMLKEYKNLYSKGGFGDMRGHLEKVYQVKRSG